MFRLGAILTALLLVLPVASVAQARERPLERAMDLMRDGNWAAAQIEARGQCHYAADPCKCAACIFTTVAVLSRPSTELARQQV